jgi:hypothetical protein
LIASLIAVLTLSMFSTLFMDTARAETETDYWAVIVCATSNPESAPADAAYAYHVLSAHYDFDDICYLHYDTDIPEVDMIANTTNFRWATTDWLATKCEEDLDTKDVIFIYFVGHGTGIMESYVGMEPYFGGNLTWAHGLNDENHDEMHNNLIEIQEEHVVNNWGQPIDMNGDGKIKGWVGIDECLCLIGGNVSDDEFASDLNTLNGKYTTLIFATQQCMGGGLIDDIRKDDRIILTAVDETQIAFGDVDSDGFSEWSEALFEAMHEERCKYENEQLVHEGVPVTSDIDDDEHVSMLEIFNHTSDRQDWVSGYTDYEQTVWLSDDDTPLPTFVNETNLGNACQNGSLSAVTWFPKRHHTLTVETRLTSEVEVQGVGVWLDGEPAGSSSISLDVTAGNHEVAVEPTISWQGSNHYLTYWTGAQNGNPTSVHVDENTTVVAYYTNTRYMQNAKWDSTYWKMLWNSTSTHTSQVRTTLGLKSRGYLGVKIYAGTTCISGASVVEVGSWYVDQVGLKSTNWNCGSEQNVTSTYIKVEVWYKFEGWSSWLTMDCAFRTETFPHDTILNATTWTIKLYGGLTQFAPLGPLERTHLAFFWGSSTKESRIENMSLFTHP